MDNRTINYSTLHRKFGKYMDQPKTTFLFVLFGFLVVALAGLTFLLLGENMVIPYHDQWDGEALTYLLHAKYLGTGATSYAELFNGAGPDALFAQAPFVILLYKAFAPYTAFALNLLFDMLIAYFGMFLCCNKLTGHNLVSVITAGLFAFLPLFSVYGLTQSGLPLLFYSVYLLSSLSKSSKRVRIASLIYIVFYGVSSSFVLAGFAIIGFGMLSCIILGIRGKLRKNRMIVLAFILLLATYMITNRSLITQVLGLSDTYTSHKSVLTRLGVPFGESFKSVFLTGTLHTPTCQKFIVFFTVAVIGIGFFLRKKQDSFSARLYRLLVIFFGINVLLCTFYAFCNTEAIASLRNHMGGFIKEFAFDRVYWLSVPIWYFLLAICLVLSIRALMASRLPVLRIGIVFCTSATLLACGALVFYYSNVNKSIHRILQGENYDAMTWQDFYATDVYDQIRDFINRDQSAYRVLSFGISPAAALYNGFYCLDGYSNNYDIEYQKHFLAIMQKEIDKSDEIRTLFLHDGNRLYLYCADLGINKYIIRKGEQLSISTPEYDMDAARAMGAEYLFSAIPIPGADALGLTLLRDEPFSTATSFYEIYVYGIN